MEKNKTGKYFKYATGEIVLVVVGILIALSINNWNELRKQKGIEIDVLAGIRADILQDTIDINSNIRFYQSSNKKHDLFIKELFNKKKQRKEMTNYLLNLTFNDRTLVLFDSHFQEARVKGLSIISNKNLKEKISRLYEWYYKYLLLFENSFETTNYSNTLNNKLEKYFSLDSTGIFISESNYNRLLSNSNDLYHIGRISMIQFGLLYEYQKTIEAALNVVESINKELMELKE